MTQPDDDTCRVSRNLAIMPFDNWALGAARSAFSPGINSQTLVDGLCFWFVLALRPVITFIADTSWAPSVLSARALSASNGILLLSLFTATWRAGPGIELFSHSRFLHFLSHSSVCECVVWMRALYFLCLCTSGATPCTSDSLTYQRRAGFAQKHLNPDLSKRQCLETPHV